MMGMDCVNHTQQEERDCNYCIWHTDGNCASCNCEYISRAEALEAVRRVRGEKDENRHITR